MTEKDIDKIVDEISSMISDGLDLKEALEKII